jgi:hypothetical protein
MSPRTSFQSYAEFEREYIRPALRVGMSVEDMIDDSAFETEFELDGQPFLDDPDEEDEG